MLRLAATTLAVTGLIGAAAPAAHAQGKPTPLKAGDKAPDFTLTSWDGKSKFTLSDHRAKGDAKGSIVVVDFWCAKCPASRRADPVLSKITADYATKGVEFVAVDSNKLVKGKALADYIAKAKLPFTIVEDDNFTIADKFGALVTPHVFVVDRQGVVRFAGGMTSRRTKPGDPNHKTYLRDALDALLAGRAPAVTKARAFG